MIAKNYDWALEALYVEEARDLSYEGYTQAMRGLRARNPALAKKVTRSLEPLRKELCPRSQIPWYRTSVGGRYRVALLPDNPHFSWDVALVRKALGLPKGGPLSSSVDPTRTQLAKSGLLQGEEEKTIQILADRHLARKWLSLHEVAFLGQEPREFDGELNTEIAAASRRTQLELNGLPGGEWLEGEPPAHPDCPWDRHLPIHHAVAHLLRRHYLPRHLCRPVMLHILTNSREDLEGLRWEGVQVFRQDGDIHMDCPEHTASILIHGIDEFTTLGDLERIWKEQIEPIRDEHWEARGQKPRGKQAPSLKRLREGLPIYRRFLELGSIELVLGELQQQSWPEFDRDEETVRRLIVDLQNLLEPE